MSFLSPALIGALLPLLALPVVIHLLNRSFPRHLRFPSVELIRRTLAHRSRLNRWRHWILIALRTLLLLLLLFAFLQPVLPRFGGTPSEQASRRVLIVLDHSLSMEHTGDGASSRERGVHEALKLLDSLSSDDLVNIVLLGSASSSCFVTFSKDHGEARRYLRQLGPGFTRADVNRANQFAARLLAKEQGACEVYFISDFQRKNWSSVSFESLPAEAKLFFVPVGPRHLANRAVMDARLSEHIILSGEILMLDVTIGNFSEEPFDGRVTVTVDGRPGTDQDVSIASWSESRVSMPVMAGGPGLHLCEVRLPSDALAADNAFHFAFKVQEKEEVLIVSDDPAMNAPAYFLRIALNPFENEAGPLLPRIIPSEELSSTRLAGIRKLFITRSKPLQASAVEAVAQFLLRGGGLVYFMDGTDDKASLALLENQIGRETLPMRIARKHSATNVVSGAQQIARGDFKSRFLKLFKGTARQNLALLEFYDYYQAGATAAGGVLLTYSDGTPAMAEMNHGLGTALLLNFSVAESASNLARQRLFPAWMQELVRELSVETPAPVTFTVGETLQTEIWRSEVQHDLRSPSGKSILPKRDLVGERCTISFPAQELGFYRIGSQRPLYAFGVNPSAEEADLRPMDRAALPKEFAANRQAFFVSGSEDYEQLAKGRPIFHWFLLAACCVLLLESGFQWLIRRKPA